MAFGVNYPRFFPQTLPDFFVFIFLIFIEFILFSFQFLTKFSPENFTQKPLPKTKIYHHFDVFPSSVSSTPPPEQCSANADEDSNSVPKCAKQQSFPFGDFCFSQTFEAFPKPIQIKYHTTSLAREALFCSILQEA